jgi:hypothetical protein
MSQLTKVIYILKYYGLGDILQDTPENIQKEDDTIHERTLCFWRVSEICYAYLRAERDDESSYSWVENKFTENGICGPDTSIKLIDRHRHEWVLDSTVFLEGYRQKGMLAWVKIVDPVEIRTLRDVQNLIFHRVTSWKKR